jgi:hypothetical protein
LFLIILEKAGAGRWKRRGRGGGGGEEAGKRKEKVYAAALELSFQGHYGGSESASSGNGLSYIMVWMQAEQISNAHGQLQLPHLPVWLDHTDLFTTPTHSHFHFHPHPHHH